ncbi:hypothetical protein ASE90_17145 [Sphingomonas sp. Leaf67]|uniref:hypothetical protein n=1 Tax=Sphingomonas sp. Leaf67 TaxID=1736230 RepID=UPI0006F9B07A|nr:hypothetical protein [Sphingomonas sp. Leaf67]KQN90808.1 hypothetical protein ASE90_17145 [Sphingomonas sp. Leaf67]
MPGKYRRDWFEHRDRIASLVRDEASRTIPIGGRFVCNDESEDDAMYFYLKAQGFSISDVQQCEVFASKLVTISERAIHEAISQLRLIASERSYRLQSVEAGEPESGQARILASEQDYVPWWEIGD